MVNRCGVLNRRLVLLGALLRRRPLQHMAAPFTPRRDHTSSDRDVLAAARFSDRRSLRDFWAGFLPVFFGFCEPFIA